MYRKYNETQQCDIDVYVKDKTAKVDITMQKDADKFYTHIQKVASDLWFVKHNLNKCPSVTIVDSAETKVQGEVTYLDSDNLIIKFCGAFSGKAYLN